MKKLILLGAGVITLSLFTGCSQQQQSEDTPQVVERPPQIQIRTIYKEKVHCHRFKGYGWSKKTCHSHPSPHNHTGRDVKKRGRHPSITHSHNGRTHSHPMKNPNHQHKRKLCPVGCRAR